MLTLLDQDLLESNFSTVPVANKTYQVSDRTAGGAGVQLCHKFLCKS